MQLPLVKRKQKKTMNYKEDKNEGRNANDWQY